MAILRVIRGVFFVIILAIAIMIANFIQCMSLIALLHSRRLFQRINMWVANTYCGFFGYCCYVCGNRLNISGDVFQRENSIVMANHQSYFDIPILWMLGLPMQTVGWMKWFVKDSFKWVPGMGWGLKFLNALFVKRNWSRDESTIKSTFAAIREGDIPFWIMIFPEGTRMKRSKYRHSIEYSKRKQIKPLERVLFPRPKGVWATLQGLSGKVVSVYDVSIAFTGNPPNVYTFFCTKGVDVNVDIKRHPVESLPASEREFNAWILEQYRLKDDWMSKNSKWDVKTLLA